MARANRVGAEESGGIFHLTHRCHNREFLLKFRRDRDAYRVKVRQHLRKFRVHLLDYCVTCNHVHLLIDAADRFEISRFMQEVASEFAREYNRRKRRLNAFWGDNYHATLVQDGHYLWECLCYIELNMVRCGVVKHPSEWDWVGHQEIMGRRQRYRLLDLDRLCWRLGGRNLDEMREHLTFSLERKILKGEVKREECWTESLAVGSADFVQKIEPLISSRRQMKIMESDRGLWVLHESPPPYGQ